MRWSRLGPGGGGAMYIPTVHPTDPSTVWVTCDMTGSYLTHTAGAQWRQINFTGMVRAFAFDPHDPAVLYAGSSGLYCSRNNGQDWDLMYPPRAEVVREINFGDHASHVFHTAGGSEFGVVEGLLVHPNRQGHIWLGLNGSRLGHFYDQGPLGLTVSTDEGQHWRVPVPVLGSRFIRICPAADGSVFLFTDEQLFRATVTSGEVALRPIDRAKMEYLDAAYGRHPQTGQWVYYHTQRVETAEADAHISGVYRATQPEEGWEALGEGLFADHAPGQGYVFAHIATSLSDASRVYVSLSEPMRKEDRVPGRESFFGLFRSDDLGDTFSWVLRIGDQQPGNRTQGWVEKDFSTAWGGAPFGIGTSPSDPDVCYATDWGTCYGTMDGGKSWKQLYTAVSGRGRYQSTGLDVSLVYNLCFDPHRVDRLLIACTDIGVFDSDDDGQTWHHAIQGVPEKWINSCYGLVIDPQVRGRAWSVWSNCHDLPRPKMYLNGGFDRRLGGVCVSHDDCQSWMVSSSGLPERTAPTSIVLDPGSPPQRRVLYVSAMGDGVYKSTDGGVSWQNKSDGIGENMNVWKVFRDASGGLYALVARGLRDGKEVDGALYHSADGADSWRRIPLPDRVNAPNYLAIDPRNADILYLACWPRIVDGVEGFGGLLRSANGGASWELLTNPASHVYGVAIDPHNTAHICWSNFENQVWASWDRGENAQLMKGYDFKWAHQPIFHPRDPGRLYLATFGSGLWMGVD